MTAEQLPPRAQPAPLSVAAMVSGEGRGSNLGALIEGCASGRAGWRIGVVIGTRADAPALERARNAGVAVVVVSPRKYEADEPGYGSAVLRILHKHETGLICLAGYMRKLPAAVVSEFAGR